jgi:hypothetical protein
VFCFRDGSEAAKQLEQLGAVSIDVEALANIDSLYTENISFFDQ